VSEARHRRIVPERWRESFMGMLVGVAVAGLIAGGLISWLKGGLDPDIPWAMSAIVVLVPFTVSAAAALRHGRFGVDLIAVLAIVGALAVGEFLAAAIVALMLAGGNALEATAARRARSDLTSLLSHAPRIAHRLTDDSWVEVPVDSLEPGDVVLVRAGEIVPADGRVREHDAILDESSMTGE